MLNVNKFYNNKPISIHLKVIIEEDAVLEVFSGVLLFVDSSLKIEFMLPAIKFTRNVDKQRTAAATIYLRRDDMSNICAQVEHTLIMYANSAATEL